MVRTKHDGLGAIRRAINEAVSEASIESRIEAGMSNAVKPAIEAAVEQLVDAIAAAAERFQKHPQFGRYIDADEIRHGTGRMWHDIRPKLHDGIVALVDKAVDEFVENTMAGEEDMFSNGDTYSTGGYDRVQRDRSAYATARGNRRY